MKKILQALLLLATIPLYGQTGLGTAGQQEYARALTNGGRFGAPRYTTSNRPTCNSSNIGGTIWNTTTVTEQVCDGSAWASVAVGSSGIAIGAAITGGGANRVLFEDGSQNLAASASFTYVATNNVLTLGSATTAGVATTIIDSAMGGASATDNFWNITGTMPTTLTQIGSGVNVQLTGAGSSGVNNQAVNIDYNAGYTGGFRNIGLRVANNNLGTGSVLYGTGMNATVGIHTLLSTVGNPTSAIALKAEGNAGSTERMAVLGEVTGNSGSLDVEGVVGNAINPGTAGAAGWFTLGSVGKPTGVGFALGVTNGAVALPICNFYDNTTLKISCLDGGNLQLVNNQLTAGTMAVGNNGIVNAGVHSFSWTNAQVVALGATTAGDILVATLPAKTVVKNAYVVINTACAGTTTLTVAVGRTSAAYIDYIVASDAKAAANTVYGDASAERGTNLTGYDMPSYTGTTAVNAHFVSTIQNLSATTTCTGTVILETALVP